MSASVCGAVPFVLYFKLALSFQKVTKDGTNCEHNFCIPQIQFSDEPVAVDTNHQV